jgi:hypothetical protein
VTDDLDETIARLDRIAGALERLDAKFWAVRPAVFEMALADGGGWVGMVIADPLPIPLVGWGESPAAAIASLDEEVAKLDWRRVRGFRRRPNHPA